MGKSDPAFVASPSSRQGVSTKGFNPGELADIVCRRQHGRGGPSLSEELLMRHPMKDAWRANAHYSGKVWRRLKDLQLVSGRSNWSGLTSLGYSVREEILQRRKRKA